MISYLISVGIFILIYVYVQKHIEQNIMSLYISRVCLYYVASIEHKNAECMTHSRKVDE